MANEDRKPIVELGIEFIVELLIFLYPYGADQMGLPHNFWLGLGCWIVGTVIAVRMFWIFPLWSKRLRVRFKAAIVVAAVVCFVWAFYRPVVSAHTKWVRERAAEEKAAQPDQDHPDAAVANQQQPARENSDKSAGTPQAPQDKHTTLKSKRTTKAPEQKATLREPLPTQKPVNNTADVPVNSVVDNHGTLTGLHISDSIVGPAPNGTATVLNNKEKATASDVTIEHSKVGDQQKGAIPTVPVMAFREAASGNNVIADNLVCGSSSGVTIATGGSNEVIKGNVVNDPVICNWVHLLDTIQNHRVDVASFMDQLADVNEKQWKDDKDNNDRMTLIHQLKQQLVTASDNAENFSTVLGVWRTSHPSFVVTPP